jgi:outer membrane protein OmpA-like peptidoglycan-associated protein
MGGCPDSDGDGISDNDDQCPKLPGLKADKGCPKSDMDNDGVADNLDRCPRVAGPANTGGCPDTDKDGIPNIDDNCPSIYGPASTSGCPDSDGDGVDDSRDLCPKSYGPASNSGCPEITKEDKELLAFAVENVEFEHNSSYLTVDSKPILDEIANIMRRYPDYNLMISGHTDNTGSTVYNQEMSEKRARTCYLYLMEKGISQNKLSHTGYGETKPIADNETLMGRSKNRRVEFELYPGGRR